MVVLCTKMAKPITKIIGIITIAAKAYPVDHEEKSPQKIPKPGINIGNAMVVLLS